MLEIKIIRQRYRLVGLQVQYQVDLSRTHAAEETLENFNAVFKTDDINFFTHEALSKLRKF